MRRRDLLRAGSVGVVALAGCAALGGGENEEARAAVERASEELIEADGDLVAQFDRFGTLEEEVDFDAESAREHLRTARDAIETASTNAATDGTRAEVESLRSLADYLDALAEAGAGLANAYNTTSAAIDEESYPRTIGMLEEATDTLDGVEDELDAAASVLDGVDPDAFTAIDVDVDTYEENLAILGRNRDGYALVVTAYVAFVRGRRDFEDAQSSLSAENHGSAAEGFRSSQEYFEESASRLEGRESADITEDTARLADGLANLAGVHRDLAAAWSTLSEAFARMETMQSYLDASRFDDATDELVTAEERAGEAASRLDAAREAFAAAESDEATREYPVVLDVTRNYLDDTDRRVETAELIIPGLTDFVRGIEAMDAGATEAEEENFAAAAEEFDRTSDRFGDAEASFSDAESRAGDDVMPTVIELVCNAGAFADAADRYAEAYEAAEREDFSRAEELIDEADQAANRCGSGSGNGNSAARIGRLPAP